MSSSDGYCSIVIFDEPMRLHERQQHHLQMAAIAEHHSGPPSSVGPEKDVPIVLPWSSLPSAATSKTPTEGGSHSAEILGKRDSGESSEVGDGQPVKKKRRVELKHLGGLETA